MTLQLELLLRPERVDESPRIARIQYAAFMGHPQHPPGAAPVEHLIVARLRASGALTLSLVAELGGEAVGHLALSPARVGSEREWLLLGPVGVLPAHQGRGIGSALVREALRRVQALEPSPVGVVLVGDPGWYGRFGFRSWPGLYWPGVPERYVLAASLGERIPCGEIVAHAAFTGAGC
ncbi:GNAT family N-acetyltransferase [Megalodesulfovibrio paquesii]